MIPQKEQSKINENLYKEIEKEVREEILHNEKFAAAMQTLGYSKDVINEIFYMKECMDFDPNGCNPEDFIDRTNIKAARRYVRRVYNESYNIAEFLRKSLGENYRGIHIQKAAKIIELSMIKKAEEKIALRNNQISIKIKDDKIKSR